MAEQTHAQRPQSTRGEPVSEEGQTGLPAPDREAEQKLKDDLDALLDEIDDVLEENAEEFVKDYIQKGGQ